MKKLLAIVCMLVCSVASFAQKSYPAPNVLVSPYSYRGQMLNLSNTNYQPTGDTTTNAGTLYLTTAKYSPTTGLPLLYPLTGYGSISFIVNGAALTGTPGGTVTLQQSFDGTNWAPVRASTTAGQDTLTITTASSQAYSWDKSFKSAPYYRLAITTTGTQTSSWKAWYYLNNQFYFTGQ